MSLMPSSRASPDYSTIWFNICTAAHAWRYISFIHGKRTDIQ